jgi:hypothetical protein
MYVSQKICLFILNIKSEVRKVGNVQPVVQLLRQVRRMQLRVIDSLKCICR